MSAIGRVALIAAVVVAPWIFGSVQPWPQFWLAAVVAALTLLRVLEVVAHRPEKSAHIPPASIAPLALLLIAALQLLPRPDTPAAQMDHAVFAEDAAAFSGPDHVATGTLSAASTRREAARLYFAMAAFMLAAQWFSAPESFRMLFGALTLNGVALGAFGIVQSLSWNGKLFWSVDLRFGGTPFASYVNRNNAAGYFNLCLAAAVGFAILVLGSRLRDSQRSPRPGYSLLRFRDRLRLAVAGIEGRHVAVIGLLAVLVTAVLFSLSRGGILAMGIAGAGVIATALRGFQRRALLVLTLVIGAAACGVLAVSGRFATVDDRIATLSDPLAAATGRLQHWQDTFGAVQDFPLLGTGLGTYRFANQPYQSRPAHAWYYNADNEWFEVLVEAGVVGLAAMLIGFLLISASSLYLLKQADARWWAMGAVGLFAVLSQGVQGVTDFGMIVPANALTLAVVSGAVCGAATRAAEFHQLRVPLSLSMAQLEGKVGQGLLAVVLTLAGAAFLLELFTATKADAARDVFLVLVPDSTRVEVIDAAIDRASAALQFRPDDAELHAAIGRWWIDRYRLQMYAELLAEVPDALPGQRTELWKVAALPSLALRARQLEASGQTAELDRFLRLPAVRDNLTHAQEHFAASSRHCPLGRQVSLVLSRLAFMNGKATSDQSLGYLRKTRFAAPSTPQVLIEAGALASASKEAVVADACWRRALDVSPEDGPIIWDMASQTRSPKDIMDNTLPQRADVLVGIAEHVRDRDVRSLLVNRAEELLGPSSVGQSAGDTHIVRAKLADLQSQPKSAIRRYQLALSEHPWEIEWRLRLAQLLREQGRLSEADAEYSLLSQQAPARRDIQAERRSLQLEIQEQHVPANLTGDRP